MPKFIHLPLRKANTKWGKAQESLSNDASIEQIGKQRKIYSREHKARNKSDQSKKTNSLEKIKQIHDVYNSQLSQLSILEDETVDNKKESAQKSLNSPA